MQLILDRVYPISYNYVYVTVPVTMCILITPYLEFSPPVPTKFELQ